MAAKKKTTRAKKTTIRRAAAPKVKRKIAKVMREFKEGDLHSGSDKGPKVKSRKQAIAIALSEAGVSNQKRGSKKKTSTKSFTR